MVDSTPQLASFCPDLILMGCFESKNQKNIRNDALDIPTDVFLVDDSYGLDGVVYIQPPAPPPPDYSKMETPEILKLRENLQELDVEGQAGVYIGSILIFNRLL